MTDKAFEKGQQEYYRAVGDLIHIYWVFLKQFLRTEGRELMPPNHDPELAFFYLSVGRVPRHRSVLKRFYEGLNATLNLGVDYFFEPDTVTDPLCRALAEADYAMQLKFSTYRDSPAYSKVRGVKDREPQWFRTLLKAGMANASSVTTQLLALDHGLDYIDFPEALRRVAQINLHCLPLVREGLGLSGQDATYVTLPVGYPLFMLDPESHCGLDEERLTHFSTGSLHCPAGYRPTKDARTLYEQLRIEDVPQTMLDDFGRVAKQTFARSVGLWFAIGADKRKTKVGLYERKLLEGDVETQATSTADV